MKRQSSDFDIVSLSKRKKLEDLDARKIVGSYHKKNTIKTISKNLYICYVHDHDNNICNIYGCGGVSDYRKRFMSGCVTYRPIYMSYRHETDFIRSLSASDDVSYIS
jgi:hypothetical protein